MAIGDSNVKAMVDDVIQSFVARGQFSYRDLLG